MTATRAAVFGALAGLVLLLCGVLLLAWVLLGLLGVAVALIVCGALLTTFFLLWDPDRRRT